MKRLVSLLLALCMLLPAGVFGEEVFGGLPVHEEEQAPVVEDVVLPDADDLLIVPNEAVDGPEAYRELVLLQPTNLQGTAVSTTEIQLTWGPVAFATEYQVYRKLGGETEYTKVATTSRDQLYYNDTAVTPGQVVYYRVQALNVSYDGETPVETYSPQSNTLPFITLEKPTLADPRGLDADTVRLNWSSVKGATTYEVEIAGAYEGAYGLVRKDLTGTLCNVDGLLAAQGYYFRVRAVRTFSSGEKFYSEYSNICCGTPMDRPVLNVNVDGSNAVLTWSESSGATGYIIYRKIGGGSYQKLAIVEDVTTYVDENLTPGQVCYYFVYAMRPVGDYNCFSLSSTTRYFTVVGAVELCAVQNTGDQEQTIDWATHAAGASKYYVYAATSKDGLYTKIGEVYATKFVATGLEPGQTYYYKVRPVREFSNGDISYGPWSNIMSQAESGQVTLTGLSAVNATLNQDISGGYVGDVFNWSVNVAGGSGAYDFKWSLVSLNGLGTYTLQDYSGSYTMLPEGSAVLTENFGMVLTEAMIGMISNDKYAMQVEVRDTLGATAVITACGDTYAELNFVSAAPTTKQINVTMRVGDTYTMDHGIYAEAGDAVLMDISNPTGAVLLTGYTLEAVSNGYATVLMTPQRFKNDVLVCYNITIGYATLAINRITPAKTEAHTHEALAWDINYTGGRAPYTVNLKVYNGSTLVSNKTTTEYTSGLISANYLPGVVGEYTLEATIVSTDGQSATLRSAVTTVKEYNPLTVLPSTTGSYIGGTVTWVTEYTGDSAIYRRDYTLYCDGEVVVTTTGTNDVSFTHVPAKGGSYVLTVTAYEANGNVITVTAPTVVVANQGEVPTGTIGRVTGNGVALRTGPGTNHDVITRLSKGKKVTIIKLAGDWFYVEYNGKLGYIHTDYVEPITD